METRVNNAQEWFEKVCRQFAEATGWPLNFTPFDPALGDSLETQFREDANCCWFTEIHDGNEVAGFLHIDLPEDSKLDRSFLAVSELADVLATLLSRLTRTTRQLDSRTRDVSTLVDIGRSVPRENDFLDALNQLLRATVELTEFRSSTFFLLDSTTSELRLRNTYQIDPEQVTNLTRELTTNPPDLEALVRGSVVIQRQEFPDAEKWLPEGSSTGVCVSIQSTAGPLGTLWAYDRRLRIPGHREMHVLESIASQISAVLERVVLRQESKRQLRVKRELELVSENQSDDIQFELPEVPKFEVAARCLSRHELGGDLCELMPIDENRMIVAIGDACGDSIPAAIVMTAARGALHALKSESVKNVLQPNEVIRKINRTLYAITPSHQFMSFLYGILDTKNMTFTYSNAGHPTPILMRNGQTTSLVSHGMLLGVTDEATYEQSTIELVNNDLLILFSDGIIEAMNQTRQMFRSDGIVSAIMSAVNGSAQEVMDEIWGRFESHSAGGGDPDDRTLLVIRMQE